jgi:hypothetical protein
MAAEFGLRNISINVRKVLLHAVNLRHGTDGFTSPPKEVVLRSGSNPRTLGPVASTLTTSPPRATIYKYIKITSLLCLTAIYANINMSQHNGMDSIKIDKDNTMDQSTSSDVNSLFPQIINRCPVFF